MIVNVEFIVVGGIVSKAVDWIFQSQWEAVNKTKSIFALFQHSLVYSLLTVDITSYLLNIQAADTVFILSVLLLTHMIIDNRRVVKLIMRLKGLSQEQISSKEYGWLQLGIDQILHEVVILTIGIML